MINSHLNCQIIIDLYNIPVIQDLMNIDMPYKSRLLLIIICLLMSVNTYSDDEKIKSLTPEQMDEIKEAEIKYKDNPYALRVINQLKDAVGITDEEEKGAPPSPEEPAPPTEQPVRIEASMSTADDAYARGDYDTAIKHYQALAEEGDPNASIILGTMYEQGKGTEADKATAYAWYKKAAEIDEDDQRGKELMNLLEQTSMTEEDMAEAEQRYSDINKPDEESDPAEQKTILDSGLTSVQETITTGTRRVEGSGVMPGTTITRILPFKPTKITDISHPKLHVAGPEIVLRPEKFYRSTRRN